MCGGMIYSAFLKMKEQNRDLLKFREYRMLVFIFSENISKAAS